MCMIIYWVLNLIETIPEGFLLNLIETIQEEIFIEFDRNYIRGDFY